jgi:3-phosphoglycerate kinase
MSKLKYRIEIIDEKPYEIYAIQRWNEEMKAWRHIAALLNKNIADEILTACNRFTEAIKLVKESNEIIDVLLENFSFCAENKNTLKELQSKIDQYLAEVKDDKV